MTGWFYNSILLLAYVIASPWFLYRSFSQGKRCQNWRQRLFGLVDVRNSTAECFWFHAVSVGEVNLLSVIIDKLKAAQPDLEIVVSSTTRTGYELARKKFQNSQVFYAPIDFSWSVNSVIRRLRPSMLVLSELEIWPNMIGLVHRAGIPVAVINGRISDNSFRGYRRFRWLLTSVFEKLALVCAQTEVYSNRFVELGARSGTVVTTGSIKFDGASFDRDRTETVRLRSLAGFGPNETIFLAGSTQPGEERLAAEVYQDIKENHKDLRLIVVPRHVERASKISEEIKSMGLTSRLRSSLDAQDVLSSDEILIVDSVGELGFWWGLAKIGFVGGSFGKRGGQNMLEPAALGVATCFGPNTRNFRQIVQTLLENKAAIELASESDMPEFVRRCLEQPEWANELGRRSAKVVAEHQGASNETLNQLIKLMNAKELPSRNAA